MQESGTITVTLFGAAGRMGSTVLRALNKEHDISLLHVVDTREHAGSVIEGYRIESADSEESFAADVWIDVSLAAPAYKHALAAEKAGIPILIAATGFDEDQVATLDALSNAHILAPNLSPGVNLLFQLAPVLRTILGDSYDVAIQETHHRHKKDLPSGTAGRLRDILEQYGDSVQVTSHRLGEIVGEHEIRFVTDGEEITLAHKALSRMAFAAGVAPAVRFLAGKESGSYTMTDVLGLGRIQLNPSL